MIRRGFYRPEPDPERETLEVRMKELQPEMEKLREKYKDDQQSLNAEMMKLYREKGVNPANMLGCLPMFLQMPIWVALYAMLYYAIELRHESAFYGIFQAVSGGNWAFLADLSAPDNFIKFSGTGFSIPLFVINFHMTGINVLPILMGVMLELVKILLVKLIENYLFLLIIIQLISKELKKELFALIIVIIVLVN